MKKSGNLFVVLGIIAALVIGLLIGLSVDYPRLSKRSVSGTIGKVNNYRKTQISEADIQLKNELVTDTVKLKILQGYFNFYYVSALKMNADVELALKEATAIEAFQVRNKSLTTSLDNYGKFLLSARTDLMMALAACKSVKEVDPILLRNALNQGRNVVAQINYRDRIVLDFVDALSTFIKSNKPGQFQGLEKAHDLLIANQIYTALITKNKAVLKYLDKTALFCKSQENLNALDQQNLSTMIQQDMEKLGRFNDVEKLKEGDAESLKASDTEKLGRAVINDAEKLGWYHTFGDAQKLGSIAGDAEKLGQIYARDTEKLRCDVEKLGALDAEKLGTFRIFDAEKLGGYQLFSFDAEKLSHYPTVLDAESLGARPVAIGSNSTIMGKAK